MAPNPQSPARRRPALAGLRASLLRAALARADRVVCVASSQQDSLRRTLGLPDQRLPVVPSGVDAGFYTPAAPPRDEGYVLAAGRDLGRDYATLLAAATNLSIRRAVLAGPEGSPHPRPLAQGEGSTPHELRSSYLGRAVRIVAGPANLAGLTLPPGVCVEYSLPPVELRERYRGAACVVVPTHGDGYPRGSDCSGTLVMLDAMACSKPVVVTHRRSIGDYLSPNPTALTVPPGEPTALYQAIQEVLASPDLAHRLGAAGRQAVEDRFNTRAMAGELAGVFFEVYE